MLLECGSYPAAPDDEAAGILQSNALVKRCCEMRAGMRLKGLINIIYPLVAVASIRALCWASFSSIICELQVPRAWWLEQQEFDREDQRTLLQRRELKMEQLGGRA